MRSMFERNYLKRGPRNYKWYISLAGVCQASGTATTKDTARRACSAKIRELQGKEPQDDATE